MSKYGTITAKFEIVTPMFLGGADHEATRIRGTAIKGALAFWWRALNFARFVADAKGDDIGEALRAMQEAEQKLFGGPNGQGAFLLRVGQAENIPMLPDGDALNKDGTSFSDFKKNDNRVVGVGARYLGYGIINAFYTKANHEKNKPKKEAGELERSCIKAGHSFSVQFIFKEQNRDVFLDEIVPAIKLFGLLGGLGARVRRGWGSISLTSLTGDIDKKWSPIESVDAYKAAIQKLFNEYPSQKMSGKEWPLTAFAQESQIHVGTNIQSNPLDTLNALGEGFLRYRGWRNGDKNFKDDHDWFRNDKGNPRCSPKRTAFGLPHNYAKKLGITAPDDISKTPKKEYDRRASPLLFHVHKTQDGQSFYVVTYLPTRFMFVDSVAINKNDTKRSVEYNYAKVGRSVIEAFLNNKKPDGTPPTNGDYLKAKKVLP